MISKLTRRLLVAAALIFSSALSLNAITQDVGYVSSSMSFTFSANTDADVYILNLDTNQYVARAWYDYFSGSHAEAYVEGVSDNGGGGDSVEVYNLPPGNYRLEMWGGPFGNSVYYGGWGYATFYYLSPYGNGYVWASSINFGIN